MEWIYNLPEPFRTILAAILAVITVILLFCGPAIILAVGVAGMLNSDKNKKDN